jgi:hypothetical protein
MLSVSVRGVGFEPVVDQFLDWAIHTSPRSPGAVVSTRVSKRRDLELAVYYDQLPHELPSNGGGYGPSDRMRSPRELQRHRGAPLGFGGKDGDRSGRLRWATLPNRPACFVIFTRERHEQDFQAWYQKENGGVHRDPCPYSPAWVHSSPMAPGLP